MLRIGPHHCPLSPRRTLLPSLCHGLGSRACLSAALSCTPSPELHPGLSEASLLKPLFCLCVCLYRPALLHEKSSRCVSPSSAHHPPPFSLHSLSLPRPLLTVSVFFKVCRWGSCATSEAACRFAQQPSTGSQALWSRGLLVPLARECASRGHGAKGLRPTPEPESPHAFP